MKPRYRYYNEWSCWCLDPMFMWDSEIRNYYIKFPVIMM